MAWIVKDTSKLADYGFKLENIYDERDDIKAWTKELPCRVPLDETWIEVMETGVDDDGNQVEAEHKVCIMNAVCLTRDDDWESALPELVKLYNDNIIEWR